METVWNLEFELQVVKKYFLDVSVCLWNTRDEYLNIIIVYLAQVLSPGGKDSLLEIIHFHMNSSTSNN